ncbi:MAG: acyl-CoA/acyl-ACP dehydrogenase, partial [Candidatus Bathyarchaeota archaeon]|nr:acyl-CoA/acyl-ACP dehydrogenase [Candidatus Bathyarchaeota archaeon]
MLENNFLLSYDELKIREEAKELVKSVNSELIRKMDTGEVDYPFPFLKEAARRNLLGLRFSSEYGGRGLKWTHEVVVLEEISVLGAGIGCCYAMPSIVGEALSKFGTKEQKEKYLKPIIKGEILSAECLTEPRGGSDFFGTTTTAVKRGNKYVLNGEKRFIAGGAYADIFLVYARTNLDPSVPGYQALSCFIVEKGMGVRVGEVYG